MYQVIPGGVVIRIVFQIDAQSVSQGIISHLLFQFPHHDRCLVIDDISVEQTGLVQVIQRLLYRMGAVCPVSRQCRDIVGLDEVQVVVDLWELFPGNLVGHEIGVNLLGPYIIKPFHRHQVTKPHVGGLVGKQLQAVELLVGRGVFP